jgi:hypothetical protein
MNDVPWYVKAGLAGFTMALLPAALILAYARGDDTSVAMVIGAIIAGSSQAISYYFGSSESSAKKDATIAQVATAPAPQDHR